MKKPFANKVLILAVMAVAIAAGLLFADRGPDYEISLRYNPDNRLIARAGYVDGDKEVWHTFMYGNRVTLVVDTATLEYDMYMYADDGSGLYSDEKLEADFTAVLKTMPPYTEDKLIGHYKNYTGPRWGVKSEYEDYDLSFSDEDGKKKLIIEYTENDKKIRMVVGNGFRSTKVTDPQAGTFTMYLSGERDLFHLEKSYVQNILDDIPNYVNDSVIGEYYIQDGEDVEK